MPDNLSAQATFDVGSGQTVVEGNPIIGDGDLTKNGTGTLQLTAVNTFTGSTYLNAGTLQLSGGSDRLPTGSSLFAASGSTFDLNDNDQELSSINAAAGSFVTLGSGELTLSLGSGESATLAGTVTGTGGINLDGAGTLISTGSLNHSGATNINSGTLDLNDVDQRISVLQLDSAATIDLGSATLTLDPTSTTLNLDGVISGTGSLVHTGKWTVDLNGNNTFSGGVLVEDSGTVEINHNNGAGTGSITLAGSAGLRISNGINLSNAVVLKMDNKLTVSSGTATYSGALSESGGSYALTKDGAGTLLLSSTTSHSGGTVVSGGTLSLSGGNDRLLTTGDIALTGSATLDLDDHDQTVADLDAASGTTIDVGSGTLTVNQGTGVTSSISGLVRGSGNFVVQGAGTVDLAHASNNAAFTGVMMVSGGGTLRALHESALGSGGVTLNDGTLNLVEDGFFESDITLTGSSNIAVDSGTAFVFATVSESGGSHTLTKTGDGTLQLLLSSGHTGGTVVEAGRLRWNGDNHIANTSDLAIRDGAVIDLVTRQQTFRSVDADAGSSIELGSGTLTISDAGGAVSNLDGIISESGNLKVMGGAVVNLNGDNTYSGATTLSGGSTLNLSHDDGLGSTSGLAVTSSTLTLADTVNSDGTLIFNSGTTVNVASGTGTLSGTMSGSGGFEKTGSGTLVLAGANSNTGDITVSAGTLSLSATNQLGAEGVELDVTGGAVVVTSSFTTTNPINIGAGGATFAVAEGVTFTSDWDVTGSGAFTLTGEGTFAIGDGIGFGHDGDINIQNGTLRVDKISGYRELGRHIDISGDGRLFLDDANFHAGDLDVSATASVDLGFDSMLYLGTEPGTTSRIDGAITSGSSLLFLDGAGTVELNAANTFTGITYVRDTAMVEVGHDQAFGHAANDVELIGGTVNLGGHTIAQEIELNGGKITGTGSADGLIATASRGGTIAPGNSPGLMTFTDRVTLSAATTIEIELAGLVRGTSYDAIDVSGTLTFAGTLEVTFIDGFTPSAAADFQIFNATSIGGSFATINLPTLADGLSWNTDNLASTGMISVTGSAVPEPATFATLLGLFAIGMTATRRRRKRSA